MNFYIEYRNDKDKGLANGLGCIHLVAKHYCEALKEAPEIIRTLEENSIYEWSLISKKDGVIYE